MIVANHNYGKCPFCTDKLEFVHHYIIKCPKYRKYRFILHCDIM